MKPVASTLSRWGLERRHSSTSAKVQIFSETKKWELTGSMSGAGRH